MFKKTKEMVNLLEKSGHRKSFKVIKVDNRLIKMKRATGRPRDLDDLRYLKKLKEL